MATLLYRYRRDAYPHLSVEVEEMSRGIRRRFVQAIGKALHGEIADIDVLDAYQHHFASYSFRYNTSMSIIFEVHYHNSLKQSFVIRIEEFIHSFHMRRPAFDGIVALAAHAVRRREPVTAETLGLPRETCILLGNIEVQMLKGDGDG